MHKPTGYSLMAAAALLGVAACTTSVSGPPASLTRMMTAKKGPYLEGGPLFAGLELVPPPPSAGSADQARDLAAAEAATREQSGPRWELATKDADLAPAHVAADFSCAAAIAIDKDETPALVNLVGRAAQDLGSATVEVKKHYMRPRPFMVNGKSTCTPTWENGLRRDGSYPSGHSAIGFGTSLILAEIIPERAAQIIARGKAFGDSRRICNVHWLSDIEQGRMIATAMVMRLNADPLFQADLATARKEVEAQRSRAATASSPACAQEALALSATAAQ